MAEKQSDFEGVSDFVELGLYEGLLDIYHKQAVEMESAECTAKYEMAAASTTSKVINDCNVTARTDYEIIKMEEDPQSAELDAENAKMLNELKKADLPEPSLQKSKTKSTYTTTDYLPGLIGYSRVSKSARELLHWKTFLVDMLQEEDIEKKEDSDDK